MLNIQSFPFDQLLHRIVLDVSLQPTPPCCSLSATPQDMSNFGRPYFGLFFYAVLDFHFGPPILNTNFKGAFWCDKFKICFAILLSKATHVRVAVVYISKYDSKIRHHFIFRL